MTPVRRGDLLKNSRHGVCSLSGERIDKFCQPGCAHIECGTLPTDSNKGTSSYRYHSYVSYIHIRGL